MIQKFEAFVNSKGELDGFSLNPVYYQGEVAFIFKDYKKTDVKEYKIYGDFTFTDDAKDMEKGHKVFTTFPGYIKYDIETGLAEPILKGYNAWDEFEGMEDDLDDLCHLVVAKILE